MSNIIIPPAPTREDLSLIIRWIEETQKALESAFNFGMDGVRLKKIYMEPKKPRDGDVVYVGTPTEVSHWDPAGDGTGGYFGYHDGDWVKLG